MAASILIHDRDGRYGVRFDCRMRHLGIKQVRTPFRGPRANSIAERWVKSARTECLDHLFVFNEAHLRPLMSAYVRYFNRWRPHRSLGQRAPCDSSARRPRSPEARGRIVAEPVLGALHHICKPAARGTIFLRPTGGDEGRGGIGGTERGELVHELRPPNHRVTRRHAALRSMPPPCVGWSWGV
jgi:hypothetical protein